ncbi:MAG TPA: hypothetical protein VGP05_18420, partial [Pseudonocardia sp.]|nr:hypothetical protein [Pseudonocardia sp.]
WHRRLSSAAHRVTELHTVQVCDQNVHRVQLGNRRPAPVGARERVAIGNPGPPGPARLRTARLGSPGWRGPAGAARLARPARPGSARLGPAWHGPAWHGPARLASPGSAARLARPGWRGRPGPARHGWLGPAQLEPGGPARLAEFNRGGL